MRLAFVVSHPIQYYAPLYRSLAQSVDVRVFFTWHGGNRAVVDQGFGKPIAWDIPLTDGYQYNVLPNISRNPGTHHFCGLRNPGLSSAVFDWKPDVVHITGYSYVSHLKLMRDCSRRGVPSIFRGDSHLLDQRKTMRWLLKKQLLKRVFRWPTAFLCVGTHNHKYYREFGVPESRLFSCVHSIDVTRFAETGSSHEQQANEWRASLGLNPHQKTVLFAGKLEAKKRPLEFIECFLKYSDPETVLIVVGDGALGNSVSLSAKNHPDRIRLLPFQNQSVMPIVYRLGDVFVLPSGWGETWGLAVNEALACGKKVLVSDRVGCAVDIVRPGFNGDVFAVDDWEECGRKLNQLVNDGSNLSAAISEHARQTFGFDVTIQSILDCAGHVCNLR